MSRSISLDIRGKLYASETGEELVGLITITHADFASTIRLSAAPVTLLSENPDLYGLTSRSNIYEYVPMYFMLPDDDGEKAPSAQITMENIDRRLISAIRSINTPATVKLELVAASALDVVVVDFGNYQSEAFSYDSDVLTIDFTVKALTDISYPADEFGPSGFNGLF